MPLVRKECRQCGGKFETNRSYQKFCCAACKDRHRHGGKMKAKKQKKNCAHCDTQFTTTDSRTSYCSYQCKCRARYIRNRPKILSAAKKHYAENQQVMLDRKAKYVSENRDKVLEGLRRNYRENAEARRAYRREYVRNNPEKIIEGRAMDRKRSRIRQLNRLTLS